jgi:hypothetical protein
MLRVLDYIFHPIVWIVIPAILLLANIILFLISEQGAKDTMVFGTIHILMIGWNCMKLQEEKER